MAKPKPSGWRNAHEAARREKERDADLIPLMVLRVCRTLAAELERERAA